MRAAKYHKRLALLTGLLALVVLLVSVDVGCSDGACGGGNFGFPLRLSTLIGLEEPAELPDELTLLVIGVDSRKGSETVHCDAIHQIHINTVEDEIEFVNVPRGTSTFIPKPEGWEPRQELIDAARAGWGQKVLEEQEKAQEEAEGEGAPADPVPVEYLLPNPDQEQLLEVPEPTPEDIVALAWEKEQYISNVCEYIGVDEFVHRIDAMTGHETDYRVMVGFSQAQGILRVLRMDPTATLQFLRHRQSYGLGDIQRSYNQSVFLQDLLVERFDQAYNLPLTAQAALYQFVDTDMPYGVARGLMQWLSDSEARQDRSRISHRTAPAYTPRAQEMHLDPERAQEQVEELLGRLARYRPGFTVSDIQPTLLAYANQQSSLAYAALVDRDLVEARAAIDPLLEQQIWHQIEDDVQRHAYMVRIAMLDSTIAWYETGEAERAIQETASIGVLLKLEDAQTHIEELERHLSILFHQEVKL